MAGSAALRGVFVVAKMGPQAYTTIAMRTGDAEQLPASALVHEPQFTNGSFNHG
jgi:hypothetical protein